MILRAAPKLAVRQCMYLIQEHFHKNTISFFESLKMLIFVFITISAITLFMLASISNVTFSQTVYLKTYCV